MIKKIFSWLISPLGRIGLLIVGLILLSVAVWGISLTQTAPNQPIEADYIPDTGVLTSITTATKARIILYGWKFNQPAAA